MISQTNTISGMAPYPRRMPAPSPPGEQGFSESGPFCRTPCKNPPLGAKDPNPRQSSRRSGMTPLMHFGRLHVAFDGDLTPTMTFDKGLSGGKPIPLLCHQHNLIPLYTHPQHSNIKNPGTNAFPLSALFSRGSPVHRKATARMRSD